ncbi:hypothetical protein MVUOKPPV_CDS0290 [Klebsiella phage phi1_175008]|uniref:Uncharacterized protein n=1 Tax=Klebsiella phage phi1_175008 TaxID=3127744 RepID=A0ACD5FS54_9CAUD
MGIIERGAKCAPFSLYGVFNLNHTNTTQRR